jgi:putative inorganic carbon (hco3(-)) transporter
LRDIAITALIFGMLPFVLRNPWMGVLMWLWVSIMNPQHFAFGFAPKIPFAMIIALVTMVSIVTSKEKIRLPVNATTILFFVFPIWMCVTYAFALEHEESGYKRWEEVMKIFFFILVSSSLIKTRQHVQWMIWVIVLSVGFFGIKGGLFTILSGGGSRVYGPPGSSFMSDNNAISVALVMAIPLMFFLRTVSTSKWVKLGLLGAMGLSAMAVLGSHSRGAFLAVSAMLFFLWLKSRKKLMFGIFMVALIPVAIGFMPEHWTERMKSIENYKEDGSAMGRINSWYMAFNVANDRPLVGGGFELYTPKTFARYAPDPEAIHAAHSIYFQMLGEHGYVGLLLFLAIGIGGWLNAGRIVKITRDNPDLKWDGDFARAIQVSLIGYAVGGLFVNIGYWEIQYYEIIGVMVVSNLLKQPKPGLVMRAQSQQTNPIRS